MLVGPQQRIREAANLAGLDISRLRLVDTPDDPVAAAQRAAELARDGTVAALIKGALSDPEFLAPVAAPETGLRTDSRLSHAYFLDVPGQPRFYLLSDALLNVTPNLAAKKDILQNTVRLAVALGLSAPNVALLAAMDSVNPAFPSTAEAAALRAMASEGLFPGAVVDGPMTPDVALWGDPARSNGKASDLAGRADVLIAPTMESAVMVLRTLTGATGGLAAGIVLGAKVPIVAPSRADSMETRMASCVLASLAANASKTTAASIVPAAAARVAA
jgi:phosphate butyryltransferase